MDCKLCERELENYLQNRLSPNFRIQVENHLNHCERCSQSLFFEKVASDAILSEKKMMPDSLMSEKVMRIIHEKGDSSESKGRLVFIVPVVVRKIAYAASIAAAIYMGIVAGNFYLTEDSIPAEMSYINDVQIEAINLFTNEN